MAAGDQNLECIDDYHEMAVHYLFLKAAGDVKKLRGDFEVVSQFIQNPKGQIKAASDEYVHTGKGYFLSKIFAIERHRAEVSLLLGLRTYIEANRELNRLTVDVASFKDFEDSKAGDDMMRDVLVTSESIRPVIEHVKNCMDVLRGRRYLFRTPK